MSTEPLLEMKGITKIFPGVKALDRVNFSINKGEIHLLLGENGAGKSTLIKTIVGINKADEGNIFWNGEEVHFSTLREAYDAGIAVIYQELSNVGSLNVIENMFLGKELKKNCFIDWKEEEKRTKKALQEVGLTDIDIHKPMNKLGVGQKQLVEIARALMDDVELLIMDEPTSSLSYNEINNLLNIMQEMQSKGIAILFITHKLDEGQKVGDRLTVLRDGKNSGKTVAVEGLNEDDIITMMAGKSLEEKFPARFSEIGEEVFSCKNLTGEKFEKISFNLRKGELLGIFGLIGSGRTELARGIFGVDSLVEGKIVKGNKELVIRNVRDAISNGIVLLTENRKEDGLVLIHDVIDNASIVNLKSYKNKLNFLDHGRIHNDITKLADKINLRPRLLDRATKNYSGGNQQKIVVMKWILNQGDIFIFDEPTKGVDVGAKVEIYNIMNSLLQEGKSIIMISSEIEEIQGMSDRIMMMYDGQMVDIIDNTEYLKQETLLSLATGGKKSESYEK